MAAVTVMTLSTLTLWDPFYVLTINWPEYTVKLEYKTIVQLASLFPPPAPYAHREN